ncbi:hypothetical protein BJ165DRAFT_1408170 [Panaeolus papilionaceus]|nr:hypothetical protein BJ165DRAFT_1408170 [Panaeolus papilionaceus]
MAVNIRDHVSRTEIIEMVNEWLNDYGPYLLYDPNYCSETDRNKAKDYRPCVKEFLNPPRGFDSVTFVTTMWDTYLHNCTAARRAESNFEELNSSPILCNSKTHRNQHGKLWEKRNDQSGLAQLEDKTGIEVKTILDRTCGANEELLAKFVGKLSKTRFPPTGFEVAYRRLQNVVVTLQIPNLILQPERNRSGD